MVDAMGSLCVRSLRPWAIAAVLALMVPTRARAAEPAAAQPTTASEPVPETWDEVIAESPPPDPPTPAPTPAPVVPAAPPKLTRPSPEVIDSMRRSGNALLIGAGAATTVAILLNGLRVYLVTGPCQTDSQDGCRPGWFATTPFTFGANFASFGLAAAAARERGTYDGWMNPDRHRRRAPIMLSVGIPLIVLGAATSITLRAVWLGDYESPENGVVFDFAKPADAFAYYGGQQLAAIAVAVGIGMLTYNGAGGRIRRHSGITTPWIGPRLAGLQYVARF